MKRIFYSIIILVIIACSAYSMGTPPQNKEAAQPQKTDATTNATEYSTTKESVKEPIPPLLAGKKVLFIIASKDFRDEEYLTPRRILEEYGASIIVASSNKDGAIGIMGTKVKPDILLKDVKIKNYNAFVFVGGPGAEEYFDNETAFTIASEAFAAKKTVAAICIAPVILANSGILSGKKATVWHDYAGTLRNEGVIYTGADVEVYGKIITANGPAASEDFANAIIKALK